MKTPNRVARRLAVSAGSLLMFAVCTPRSPAPVTAPLPGVVKVHDPRVESLVRPIGLGTARPRFSWKLASDEPGQTQTAYQLRVAAAAADLAPGGAALWDSGKVDSDATTFIEYAGPPLASRQALLWSVRLWDRAGRASEFSVPEPFELGLLTPGDWQARWITAPPTAAEPASGLPDGGVAPPDLSAARWIWFPETMPGPEAPVGKRWLRRVFDLPRGASAKHAHLAAGVNDRVVLYVNGREVGRRALNGEDNTAINVTAALVSGRNVLVAEADNTGGRAGFIARLDVTPQTGAPFSVVTDATWRVSDGAQRAADLGRSTFSDRAWPIARDLAGFGQKPFEAQPTMAAAMAVPAPIFKKTFALDGEIASARIYLSGLGYHDLHINGRRISDHVLDPSFTNYDHRVLYLAHDVTAALTRGDNAIGVMLGNGFFHPHPVDVWDFQAAPWRAPPQLLLQLHVRFTDGRESVIASDETWKVLTGPVVFDGTRNGETYDARRARPDFSRAGGDETGARPALPAPAPRGKIVAQDFAPIRVTDTITPIAVTEPSPGVFVFDLGRNITGWGRLHVTGPAGTRVRLRYGELLSPAGRLDRKPLAGLVRNERFEEDHYVLAGTPGGETWEPRFTYHGFQYVEVQGFPGRPTTRSLAGRVVHTDFGRDGKFSASLPLLNQLQAATQWSYRGNFHGIPTDCPHREKNGWTADAHLAIETAFYNFDNGPAYRKWTNDLIDSQNAAGQLPGIVPSSGWGYGEWSGPSWEAALFLIPWALYEFEGDREILARVYPAWGKYIAYLQREAKGELVDMGLGDWVPFRTKTPEIITSSSYYYRVTVLAAKAARLLGKPDDEARFAALAERIRKAFAAKFIDAATGKVAGNEMTSLAAALDSGLAQGEVRARIARRLADAVVANGYHLDTGVVGAKFALRALSDNGFPEIAYRVASESTYPSWGHWITQGATTLWESWDGAASRNHIFFGDISAFFYRVLAGIRPDIDDPGYRHIIFAPHVPAALDHAEAEVATVRGRVAAGWKKEAGGVRFMFTVPVGSHATVSLAAADAAQVAVQNGGATSAPVRPLGLRDGRVQYAMDAGNATFVVRVSAAN